MSQLTRDQKLAMGGLGAAIVVTLVVTIVMPAIRLWSCEAGESPCGPEPSLSVEYGRLTPLSRVTEARVREGEDDDAEAERQQVLERAEEARIAEDEWQAERATRLEQRRAELARIDEEEWHTEPALTRSAPVSFASDDPRSTGLDSAAPVAGLYQLESFTTGGRPLPAAGSMQVTQIESDLFSYAAAATNLESGARVHYNGLLRRRASQWAGVTQPSDGSRLPVSYTEALIGIRFDGTALIVTSGMNRSVWRR